MKWLDNPGCWVFDDGRVAMPSKQGLRYPKQTPDSCGYLRMHIGHSRFSVHRFDNRVGNLRWATQTEQVENSEPVLSSVTKYGLRKKEDPKEYHRRQEQVYRDKTRQAYNQYQRDYRKLHSSAINSRRRELYAARKAASHLTPASSQEP